MSIRNPVLTNAKNHSKYSEIITSEEEEKIFSEKLNEFSNDVDDIKKDKETAAKNIEKWYNEYGKDKACLDDELKTDKKPENTSKPKRYEQNLVIFAGGGLAFVAALLIMSAVCASGDQCNGNNIPLQILESQFMIVLVGTIIAPVVVRVMKEKYDIQIEESQVAMIMQDAISTVKMYSKEANKMRDSNGVLSADDQKDLRNIAFTAIKTNYSWDKYRSVVSNVGVQIFDKAIESAVKKDQLERLPLEKKQILEIFKQGIDALPEIVEWQKLDPKVKEQFINGHIRKLMTNVGVDGWAYKTLEEYFDAEVNERLVAAALADKDTILKKLETENRHLKYTSIIVDAVTDSMGKKTK